MPKRNQAYPPEVKGHPLLEMAWQNANWKNSNFIVFINGLPGVGKSTLAQYLQFVLDRGNKNDFRCELRNWCMTQKTFIEATNRNDKVGQVIVWEEPYAAGVKDGGANARNFQKYANLQISTVFQTMRKNNHVIILTLPANSSFDKQGRSVAHCVIHVKANNGTYGSARVYLRDYNPIFNIENFPFIKKKTTHGMVRVKNLYVGEPPKSWADACNEKSDIYKDHWRKEIEQYKAPPKRAPGRDNSNKALVMRKLLANPMDYHLIKPRGGAKWDYGKMMKEFSIGYESARAYVREFKSVTES